MFNRNERNIQKLKDVFEETLEGDLKCEKDINLIDPYTLFCKAAAHKKLYTYSGNNMCMFKYGYHGNDSLLILFSIPISPDEAQNRHLSERIMQIVYDLECTFVRLDEMESIEDEGKFIYLIAIKCFEEENSNER